MSALGAAEARAIGALDRIEQALRHGGRRPAADPSSLERDCESLREECEALRRELAATNERSDRLTSLVTQAEARIDGAIHRVDELAGG